MNSNAEQELAKTATDSLEHHATIPDDSEPILQREGNRYVMFPINYPAIWRLYKKTVATFWVAEEIVLNTTATEWHSIPKYETRAVIGKAIVAISLSHHFLPCLIAPPIYAEITVGEARCCIGFYLAIQNIHAEAISNVIGELTIDPEIPDDEETTSTVMTKAEWIMKMRRVNSFGHRMVTLIAIESLFSISSLVIIFKSMESNPVTAIKDLFTRMDTDLENRIELLLMTYHHLEVKPAATTITDIVIEAVNLERIHASHASFADAGLGKHDISNFIEHMGDELLEALDCPRYYNVNSKDWAKLNIDAMKFCGRVKLDLCKESLEETRKARRGKATTSSNPADTNPKVIEGIREMVEF